MYLTRHEGCGRRVVEERKDFDEFQTFSQVAKSMGADYLEAFTADEKNETEGATITSFNMDGSFKVRAFIVLDKQGMKSLNFTVPDLTEMGVKSHLEFINRPHEMYVDGKPKEQYRFLEPALEEIR